MKNIEDHFLFDSMNMEQGNSNKYLIHNISEANTYVQRINPFGNLYFISNFAESHNLGKNGGVMSCTTNTSTVILNVLNAEGKLNSYIDNFIETFPSKEFHNLKGISSSAIVYIQDKDIKAGPLVNPSDENYNLLLDLNFHSTKCNVISSYKDISYLSFKYSDLQYSNDLITPILMYIEFFKPDIMGKYNTYKKNINIACENPITHIVTKYSNNELKISLKNYPEEKVEVILDCINLQSVIKNMKYTSKCETSLIMNDENLPDNDDVCHFLLNANGDSIEYENSEYYNNNILSEIKLENENEVQVVNKDDRNIIILNENIVPSLLPNLLQNKFELSYRNTISKDSKINIIKRFKDTYVFTLYGLKKEIPHHNENDENDDEENAISKYDNLGKYRVNSHLHLLSYDVSKLDNDYCPEVNSYSDNNNQLPFNINYSHYFIDFSDNQNDLLCKTINESDNTEVDED